jgi:hypothetical protein
MAIETEAGLGFRAKISQNGTVGDDIDLIAPKNQTSRKRAKKNQGA